MSQLGLAMLTQILLLLLILALMTTLVRMLLLLTLTLMMVVLLLTTEKRQRRWVGAGTRALCGWWAGAAMLAQGRSPELVGWGCCRLGAC